MHLIRLSPQGLTSTTLWEWNQEGPDTPDLLFSADLGEPGRVVPDDQGGILAEWVYWKNRPNTPAVVESRVTRAQNGGVSEHVVRTMTDQEYVESYPHMPVKLTGDNGTAVLKEGSTLTGIDVTTWLPMWSASLEGDPVMSVYGGGVAVWDSANSMLAVIAANGTVSEMSPMPVDPTSHLQHGVWHGVVPNGTAVMAITGPLLDESLFAFPNVQGQSAPRQTYDTIDRAAVAALKYYNPISVEANFEYGGSVCRTSNGRYLNSVANVNLEFSDSVTPSGCTNNTTVVGRYHTHGRFGNDGFSDLDIANANAQPGVVWFVATPCGNIDKYIGPNFAVHVRLAEKTETPVKCVP
jgi:hypothetical protein